MTRVRGAVAVRIAIVALSGVVAATASITAQQAATADLPEWMRSATRDLPAIVFRPQPASAQTAPDSPDEPPENAGTHIDHANSAVSARWTIAPPTAKYHMEWPSAASAKLIRRGLLGCGRRGPCADILRR